MQRLVIDETLPEKLLNLTGPVELVKPDGELMAVVRPRLDPERQDTTDCIIVEGERRGMSSN